MIPIIDTHQHLWDLRKFSLPWLAGGGALAKDHLMSDYLKEAEGLNIVRTVYMEVDVAEGQHVAEAEYVLDLCKRDDNPMAGAVIGGRPASSGFQTYIERFQGNPYIKGVRQVLHGAPRGFCLKPEFIHSVRLLGQMGMRFDICIRAEELSDAAKLLDFCPETLMILDHCGNANVQVKDHTEWKHGIAEIARRPNVVCKISGIVASAKPGAWTAKDLAPIVLYCVEAFGHDRVIFASDWPVCTMAATLRQWVEAAQEITKDWSEQDRRKLFHDNAARFYKL
jgi:predicted TIM-barrel fold metal-dependent hydrolase